MTEFGLKRKKIVEKEVSIKLTVNGRDERVIILKFILRFCGGIKC